MTVATTTNKVIVQGNGVTTSFSYPFIMSSASYARVILTFIDGSQSELTSSQFSISGVEEPTGGTVTYPLSGSPISGGTSITILRELPLRQGISLGNQGNFAPIAVDRANDQSRMIDQQLQEQINRAIIVAPGDPDVDPLPAAAARAGHYLYFDSDGNPVAAASISGSVAVSAAMIPVVEAATVEEAFDLLKPAMSRYLFAADFGVVADGSTDDTAAWNDCIAEINANAYTTIIAPVGNSINTQWDTITGQNWCIEGWGGAANSILTFSSDEAITISSGSAYGLLRDVGLNNTGAATNTTLRLKDCIFQTFSNIYLGTGIGQLAQCGITAVLPAAGAAVEIRFENLYGIPADVATPLFSLLNGTNFHLSNSQFYNNATPSNITAGRILIDVPMVAPAIWDTVVVEGVDTFCWDYAMSFTASGATADGPILVSECIFDSCQTACFNFNIASGGYLKELTIQDCYMSCTDGPAVGMAGAGNYNSFMFQNNRVRIAGTDGINCTVTGNVGNLDITGNVMYDLNALAASTGTRGVQIVATTAGAAAQYTNVQVTNNLIGAGMPWTGGISTTSVPEYGILITGAPQFLNVQGNQARGSLANYSVSSTAVSSQFVSNIGQVSLPIAVTVGASPFVFTTINRMATLFVTGGTVTSVTVGGIVGAIMATNESWVAPPNTTHTMMYTGSPSLSILYW